MSAENRAENSTEEKTELPGPLPERDSTLDAKQPADDQPPIAGSEEIPFAAEGDGVDIVSITTHETGVEFVSEVRPKYIPAAMRARYQKAKSGTSQPNLEKQPIRISIQFLLTIVITLAIACALFVAAPAIGIISVILLVPGLIKLALSRQHDDMRDFPGWMAHVITCFVLAAVAVVLSLMAFAGVCIPLGFAEQFLFIESQAFPAWPFPILSFILASAVSIFVFVQLMRLLKV